MADRIVARDGPSGARGEAERITAADARAQMAEAEAERRRLALAYAAFGDYALLARAERARERAGSLRRLAALLALAERGVPA
jgi:hypothetical protein